MKKHFALLLLLASLALVVLPAKSSGEGRLPIELEGITIGTSEAEVKSKLPGVRCMDRKGAFSDRVCYDAASSIAGVPANVAVGLQDNSVRHVMVRFSSRNFSRVTAALAEQYGAATSEKREPVTTKAAVILENETRTWIRGDQRLYARRYHMKDTTVSSVVLASQIDNTSH